MAFRLPFGKKKEEALPEMPETTIPVSQVLSMRAQGMTNSQIANQLRAQGFTLSQIRDAIAQADIKSAVVPTGMPQQPMQEMPEMPPMPELPPMPQEQQMPGLPEMPPVPEMPPMPGVPSTPPMPSPTQKPVLPKGAVGMDELVEELQRIIENIIEEKWKEVEQKLSGLNAWKAKIEEKVNNLDSKVSELDSRIDDFSKTLVSKTEEYKDTMGEVSTQMEAIEKLMGKLVPSLAEEIKELRSVVEKMKKK